MLHYITAAATAATLLISPMISHATEQVDIVKTTNTSPSAWSLNVDNNLIILNTPMPEYTLSKLEQSIMRKALLRSVKILNPIG